MAYSTILSVSGLALGFVAVAPLALPSAKTVERSAVIPAEPAAIYQLIVSNKGFQTFNPYKDTDPTLEITLSGPESGVGSAFAFKGKDGKGTQTVIEAVENKSVTMQIDLGAMGQPIQQFDLIPTENGTEVRWATTSDFGYNPVGRVFGLFMDRMFGGIYERGLENLHKAAIV